MRNKILTLIMLCFVSVSLSQNKAYVDPPLRSIVLDYINDAKMRNVEVLPDMSNNIAYVVIDYGLKFPTLGYYNPNTRGIHIASFTLIDKLILRGTVYHELTHGVLLSEKHACEKCTHIMSSSSPSTFSIYANDEVWKGEVDKLFDWVKQIRQEKKIKIKIDGL